jgi:hypothetical protein
MADKPILYQPFKPPAGPCYPLSVLDGAITYQIPSSAPEDVRYPKGEWYCQNPDCVVREVTVRCKLYGEAMPTMRCPGCGKRLKFHHWLRHETLVPCKEETLLCQRCFRP